MQETLPTRQKDAKRTLLQKGPQLIACQQEMPTNPSFRLRKVKRQGWLGRRLESGFGELARRKRGIFLELYHGEVEGEERVTKERNPLQDADPENLG